PRPRSSTRRSMARAGRRWAKWPSANPALAARDLDFVAQRIARCEWQTVTAPERAGVEPVRVLLRGHQAHLLVGDGHRFRAVGRLQPEALALLTSPRRLPNLLVHERD